MLFLLCITFDNCVIFYKPCASFYNCDTTGQCAGAKGQYLASPRGWPGHIMPPVQTAYGGLCGNKRPCSNARQGSGVGYMGGRAVWHGMA